MMHKTDDYVQVPLINEVQTIIEKYNDHPDREVLEFVLPRISNQKMNSYLKVMGHTDFQTTQIYAKMLISIIV